MAVNPLLVGGGIVTAAAVVGGGLYAGGVFSGGDAPKSTGDGAGTKIELVSIKKADEYKESGDKAKFGGKFAYYFLSKSQKTENTKEWNTRLTNLKKEKTTLSNTELEALKNQTLGDKLREECGKFYEKEETDYGNAANDAKWKEVWKYCSITGKRPTTIKEAAGNLTNVADSTEEKGFANTNPGTKLGETLKDKAISTFDPANTEFWKIRQEEFKAGGLDDASASAGSSHFNKDNAANKTIQILCREAYKEATAVTSGKPTETEVKRYCTLTGK